MNSQLKNLLRTHYLDLQGYVSAGMESDKTTDKIFLNANENPYELPGLEGFNRYPEPQPLALLEAYAKAYNVSANKIAMTRGADEAIAVLTKLFCEPHQDTILTCPPTFGMYSVNAGTMPAGVTEVPLRKEDGSFALDTKAIIRAVYNPSKDAAHVKIIYLCSPNNPTGTSFDHADIRTICEETDGECVVVLDETYAEFAQAGSMTGELEQLPNLIILRTLSKSYSMAGMRMGCMLCADTDFIALVKAKALDAYPLPRASVEAALIALSDDNRKIVQDNIAKLLAERERIIPLLNACENVHHIYPSDANFLLIEMEHAQEFIEYAAAQNVIIRDFSSKPGTENCIRLSIGTPEQNDLVLTLLQQFTH